MNKIIKYFIEMGGFASMKQLKDYGFHTRKIAKLVEEGVIEKIKPGIYRLTNLDYFQDINVSYASICKSEPKGVICLISALDYFDLTDFNPSEIYYAIPHSDKPKKIEYPPVRVYYFRERFYQPGIINIKKSFGNIKIYNKEKTICDIFRYRNKLGEDIALESIKNYFRQKEVNLYALMNYAEICKVKTIITPIIKALVA